jgi:hypothetical protein
VGLPAGLAILRIDMPCPERRQRLELGTQEMREHGRQPDSDAALHGRADERRQALDHLIAVAE